VDFPNIALSNWSIDGKARPSDDVGLINDTFVVGDPKTGILQRVNPIFGPDIHLDIEAITAHLSNSGLLTPRLVPTKDGALCVPAEKGTWRLLTYIPGTTIHTISNPQQAAAAGNLVGQFHQATASLNHTFHFSRPGAHDTVLHMATLREALDQADGHPLVGPAHTLGEQILSAWNSWEGSLDLPQHICHGDLKISNIRFDDDRCSALCLLDLDTLGLQSFAVEMGDAWRSWCNPAGESAPEAATFDIEIFRASASAWLQSGPDLTQLETENLAPGIERICLELAARFCADAVANKYFKEDLSTYPQPGKHNLVRAKTQLKVAQSSRNCRVETERIITAR
jgi:hypothetical protein